MNFKVTINKLIGSSVISIISARFVWITFACIGGGKGSENCLSGQILFGLITLIVSFLIVYLIISLLQTKIKAD